MLKNSFLQNLYARAVVRVSVPVVCDDSRFCFLANLTYIYR